MKIWMIADCGCIVYHKAVDKYSVKNNPNCTLHK